VALLKPLGGMPLSGAERVSLWLRTSKPSLIDISLWEWDGSDYHYFVQVWPQEGWRKVEVALDQFKLGILSTDENWRLDVDQVIFLIVADASMLTGWTGPGTLWIDKVAFLCRESTTKRLPPPTPLPPPSPPSER